MKANSSNSANAEVSDANNLLLWKHLALTHTDQGVLVIDPQQRVRYFNPRVCVLLDVSAELLATQPTIQAFTQWQSARGDFGPQDAALEASLRDYIQRVSQGGPDEPPNHYQRVTSAGRTLDVRSDTLADGSIVRFFTDITDLVKADQALRENEARWKMALESVGDGLWDWNVQTDEEYFSPGMLRMYGYAEDDLLPEISAFDKRTHPDDLERMLQDREAHLNRLTPNYSNEHRVLCKDGSWKWVHSRGMVISRDASGKPLRMIGTHTDITERKQAEALIWQQAHFDALTGLPNRRMMQERLDHEMKQCHRNGTQLALLFIDLDHFKEVNDTLGHDRDDQLLVVAARRIQQCLREVDTVARMGGDEFTVILCDLCDASDLQTILPKLLKALSASFQLGMDQVFVSASIGATVYPDDGQDIETLFKNADQALYVAKGSGRNRFSFFTQALQEAANFRAQLTHDLRAALVTQSFRVVYQPIVELATGSIHKAEALVRWLHPSRGLISPAAFIPVAEASGLIVDIGDWVFHQAAAQVKAWRSQLHPQFQISVNKSPVQFENPNPAHTPWSKHLAARGLCTDAIYFAQICNLFCTEVSPEKAVKTY